MDCDKFNDYATLNVVAEAFEPAKIRTKKPDIE
jgi:hypothetical protein